MAKMIDKEPSYHGEKKVWRSFSTNLPQHFVVYNTRSVKGWEFDFCIMAEGIGLFVIEVKGWEAASIFNIINEDSIILVGEEKPFSSPRKQARGYRFNLVNMFKQELGMNPLVMDLVCYPFISKKEYYERRLDVVSDETETIFKEDLEDPAYLFQKLSGRYNINKSTPHDDLNAKKFALIRHHFEPNYDLKINIEDLNPGYSRLRVITKELGDEDAKVIVSEYFRGIKEIVFVCSKTSLLKLVDNVEEQLANRKICPKQNNLTVGTRFLDRDSINSSYSIFNFEVYEFEDICSVVDEDLLIEEGNLGNEEKTALKQLSDRTAFNFQQYEIEHAPSSKNILVAAGAGTGKTYSMVSRVAYLCNRTADAVVDIVSDIAMITFTNDAANNMISRLKLMFMNYFLLTSNQKYMHLIEDMSQIQISTIHKFTISLLKKECMRLGLGYDCQVSNETYRRKLLYQSYLDAYLSEKTEENPDFVHQLTIPSYQLEELLINFCDQLYNRSIDVKKLSTKDLGNSVNSMPYFNELIQNVVIRAENEYANTIKNSNLLSLRDCMIQINDLVNSGNIMKHRHKFKYIFVDEFQDTDDVQIDTIIGLQKIFGEQCRLFVVGDLKQSIYRFRGATLSAFEKIRVAMNDEWIIYSLNRNYRTDKRLLDEFHSVFSEMGTQMLLPYNTKDRLNSRITKEYEKDFLIRTILTHSKDKEVFFYDLFKEIGIQVEEIKKLSSRKKLSEEEKSIAILVRYNWQIATIVKEAEKVGVRIWVTEGGDLYRLPSTIDFYKLVMAITHPRNKVYLANLIKSNYVSMDLNLAFLKSCNQNTKTEELVHALDEYFMLNLGKKWSQLITDFESRPTLVVLREIYEATKPWITYSFSSDVQVKYRSNYECLIEKIIQKYSHDYITVNMIREFLKINITTYQEEASRNRGSESNDIKIICSTIHKSKGLEYGTVIIPYTGEDISNINIGNLSVNVLDGKLHYSFSYGNQAMDYSEGFDSGTEIYEKKCEESRILYVALTRAIRNIVWLKDLDRSVQISWGDFLEVIE